MPRHRRWRRARAHQIQNAVWLIGLGILFLTGRWWPGLLIVIGVSLVAGYLARQLDDLSPPPAAPAPPTFPPPIPAAPPPARPAPPPARLPEVCPNCGAPPRSLPNRGDPPTACPFCGSDLSADAR